MWRYYALLTDLDDAALEAERAKALPMASKMILARRLVTDLHGAEAAEAAEAEWRRVHQQRRAPSEMAVLRLAPGRHKLREIPGLPVPYGAIFWSSPRPDLQLEYWAQVLAPHWRQIIAFPSQPGFQALLEERSRNAAHPGMDQKKASFRKDLLYILATLLFIGALYLISFLNLPQGLEQSLTCTVLVLFILVLFGPPLWSQYLARYRDS